MLKQLKEKAGNNKPVGLKLEAFADENANETT
jgi:hypothetical protein